MVKLLLGIEALALGAVQGGASFCATQVRPAAPESDRVCAEFLRAPETALEHARDAAEAAAALVDAAADGALGFGVFAGADLVRILPEVTRAARGGAPALFAVLGERGEGAREAEPAAQREFAAMRPPSGSSVTVWAPASAGECRVLARAAARESRARRAPVMLYVDQVVAHLREPVDDGADETGSDAAQEPQWPAAELYRARDAAVLVVAVGIAARAARSAVRVARERGVRAGLFRPVRLWPLAEAELAEAAARARSALVAELNEGQLWEPVAARMQALAGHPPVRLLAEERGGRITPERILAVLEEGA